MAGRVGRQLWQAGWCGLQVDVPGLVLELAIILALPPFGLPSNLLLPAQMSTPSVNFTQVTCSLHVFPCKLSFLYDQPKFGQI